MEEGTDRGGSRPTNNVTTQSGNGKGKNQSDYFSAMMNLKQEQLSNDNGLICMNNVFLLRFILVRSPRFSQLG